MRSIRPGPRWGSCPGHPPYGPLLPREAVAEMTLGAGRSAGAFPGGEPSPALRPQEVRVPGEPKGSPA